MNKNKVILVLEDELPLLDAIKSKLAKSGFEVVTARSIEQAKNHIQDVENIDAIWLDHYLLGKENGLDFVAWCKINNDKCDRIPIFVVSNTASPEKVQSYLKFGVEKYYIKAEKRLEEIISDIKSSLFIE
ncbi:MAG: response regulator [Candidatus Buchananbacteria bacterium]|nr:response regulator [Candidatus Buchananbacteria bacterium]